MKTAEILEILNFVLLFLKRINGFKNFFLKIDGFIGTYQIRANGVTVFGTCISGMCSAFDFRWKLTLNFVIVH